MKKVTFPNNKIYFALLLALVLFDLLVKKFIFSHIPIMSWRDPYFPYGGIAVFQDFFGLSFSINHIANKGAAWGLFSSYSQVLFYMRLLIVVLLFAYLYFLKEKQKKVALVFVLAGAVGNIIDFFLYGHVIDMFYFTCWGYAFPLFNLADTMICIGIFLLFVGSFQKKKVVHVH